MRQTLLASLAVFLVAAPSLAKRSPLKAAGLELITKRHRLKIKGKPTKSKVCKAFDELALSTCGPALEDVLTSQIVASCKLTDPKGKTLKPCWSHTARVDPVTQQLEAFASVQSMTESDGRHPVLFFRCLPGKPLEAFMDELRKVDSGVVKVQFRIEGGELQRADISSDGRAIWFSDPHSLGEALVGGGPLFHVRYQPQGHIEETVTFRTLGAKAALKEVLKCSVLP